jgi:hypothetical protein
MDQALMSMLERVSSLSAAVVEESFVDPWRFGLFEQKERAAFNADKFHVGTFAEATMINGGALTG